MDKPIKKTATAKDVKIEPKKKPVKKTGGIKVKEIEDKKRFDSIIEMIGDLGFSLRKSLKMSKMSSATFFNWLEKDENKQKLYAHACAQRADAIAEEIIDIADDNRGDTKIIFDRNGNAIETEDKEWTGRAKLKIDARKWIASKLNPKKYGDKVEVSGDADNPLKVVHNIVALGSGVNPNETGEVKEIK
jgi:hypothetical protein